MTGPEGKSGPLVNEVKTVLQVRGVKGDRNVVVPDVVPQLKASIIRFCDRRVSDINAPQAQRLEKRDRQ